MSRHYPDIICCDCGKQCPAGGSNQKRCKDCKAKIDKETSRAAGIKWRATHTKAYAPQEHRDSVEHYIHGTTWSYHHDGVCKRCKKRKGPELLGVLPGVL